MSRNNNLNLNSIKLKKSKTLLSKGDTIEKNFLIPELSREESYAISPIKHDSYFKDDSHINEKYNSSLLSDKF